MKNKALQKKWFGWTGRHICINLTDSTIDIRENDPEVMRTFIGARGIGIHYIMEKVDPMTDAFSPENRFIFATGPLTGFPPAGNRCYVVTKSPLTNGIANSSVGGYFGVELKLAGYDFIILDGKSPDPVYLWIQDDRIEIRNAAHLWGLGTEETERQVLRETDAFAHVAEIGPAGENMARIANVMTGGVTAARAAGRGGHGGVLGSKNVKAVAVRGTRGIKVADPDLFKKSAWKILGYWENPTDSCVKGLSEHGTISVVSWANDLGILPTRNFQTGVYENAHRISGELFHEKYSVRSGGQPGKACFACPAGCSRISRVEVPGFEGASEGPEYESVASLGAVTGMDNLPLVMKAVRMCNNIGVDTISMGVTFGCAMELFEKKFLPETDAGYAMNFGNGDAMLELIPKVGTRDGFGWLLGEGSYRLADHYGHPELSMSVKKLEIPNYDPRGVKGQALAYATNNRGADHCRAEVNCSEMFECTMLGYWTPENDIDPVSVRGKAAMTKHYQDYAAWAFDSVGMCYFLLMDTPEKDLVAYVENVTGFDFNGLEGLMKAGERIFTLDRMFNLQAGLTGKDDTLPRRFLTEPMPEGPKKGQVVELDQMLPRYYELRGWDENGVPTMEKIKELGLEKYVR